MNANVLIQSGRTSCHDNPRANYPRRADGSSTEFSPGCDSFSPWRPGDENCFNCGLPRRAHGFVDAEKRKHDFRSAAKPMCFASSLFEDAVARDRENAGK